MILDIPRKLAKTPCRRVIVSWENGFSENKSKFFGKNNLSQRICCSQITPGIRISKFEQVGIRLLQQNGPEFRIGCEFWFYAVDTPRKLVETPCRRVIVSHRCSSKPNPHTVKHQKSYKKLVVPLPGLAIISRNQINRLDNSENQKLNCSTKHSCRKISVG